ncbi:MAG: hypothetical protein IJL74_01630 [Bacilli bacterium]|nr:hypothetical protein [Bacilli bacterium]
MSNIKKELTSFEEYIKINMKAIKMRNIKHKYYSEIASHDYDDYTVEEFLTLCKINRMEELGVINESVSSKLKELIDIKMQVDDLIGEEARKVLYYNSSAPNYLKDLHKMSEAINNKLKKYHLTMGDISFVDMLDATIKVENNKEYTKDQNVRTKRID